jgi:hypothetical protein
MYKDEDFVISAPLPYVHLPLDIVACCTAFRSCNDSQYHEECPYITTILTVIMPPPQKKKSGS